MVRISEQISLTNYVILTYSFTYLLKLNSRDEINPNLKPKRERSPLTGRQKRENQNHKSQRRHSEKKGS